MFWETEADTSIVVLEPSPEGLFADENPQQNLSGHVISENTGARSILHDPGNGQRIQLACQKASNDNPAMVAIVPLGPEGFDRLEAIERLLSSLHGRAVPADTRITAQQRSRMGRMLQAFDGKNNGATQKDIAKAMFKTGRMARDDWQASSYRYAVSSLLKGARKMIETGYLNLLRHRRIPRFQ